MNLRTWLRPFHSPKAIRTRTTRRFRPLVELLEGRITPAMLVPISATFTASSPGDPQSSTSLAHDLQTSAPLTQDYGYGVTNASNSGTFTEGSASYSETSSSSAMFPGIYYPETSNTSSNIRFKIDSSEGESATAPVNVVFRYQSGSFYNETPFKMWINGKQVVDRPGYWYETDPEYYPANVGNEIVIEATTKASSPASSFLVINSYEFHLSVEPLKSIWTGNGKTDNWSDAENWQGGVPTAGAALVFPAGANQLANQNDLDVVFGSIKIDDVYSFAGNLISVAGDFDIDAGASVILGNTLTGEDGTVSVGKNGHLNVSGMGSLSLEDGSSVDLFGNLDVDEGGVVNVSDGGHWTNEDGSATDIEGNITIANGGTLSVAGTTTWTNEDGGTTDMAGTLSVAEDKTLTMSGAGVWTDKDGSITTVTGKVVVAPGGNLAVDGNSTWTNEDGGTTEVSGNLAVSPTGTLTMGGVGVWTDKDGSKTTVSGKLVVAPDGTLAIDGKSTWMNVDGSETDISGKVTVAKNGVFTVAGSGKFIHKDGSETDVEGKVDFTGGTLIVDGKVVWKDVAGGETDISGNVQVSQGGKLTMSGEGKFINKDGSRVDVAGDWLANSNWFLTAGAEYQLLSHSTLDITGKVNSKGTISAAVLTKVHLWTGSSLDFGGEFDNSGDMAVDFGATVHQGATIYQLLGSCVSAGDWIVDGAGNLLTPAQFNIPSGGHMTCSATATMSFGNNASNQKDTFINIFLNSSFDFQGRQPTESLKVGVSARWDPEDALTIIGGEGADVFGSMIEEPGGHLDIFSTVTIERSGDLFDNGLVTVESGGLLHVYGSLTVTSDGVLHIFGTVIVEPGASFSLLGSIIVEPGGSLQLPNSTPTSTILGLSAPTPLAGVDLVTLTASVANATSGSGGPTGSVEFFDSTTGLSLGHADLVNGVATLAAGPFSAGTHSITAAYSGDDTHQASSGNATLAAVAPVSLIGGVYVDFNNDGRVDFGERGIAGVTITLTGIDDLGHAFSRTVVTDANGLYAFTSLRPSNDAGYNVAESQPAGFLDGADSLGTVNGVAKGSAAVNDKFSAIVLPVGGSVGENYNFGERPATTGLNVRGQAAGIGFWQNNNGQNLIKSLNGGASATQLGHWLAVTFPNLYAALDGKTNTQVAAYFKTLFVRTIFTAPGGPPKVDAQVMATALNVYVTNQTLAGTTATAYGFLVTTDGLGARGITLGGNGSTFGLSGTVSVSVMDLLLAADAHSKNGLLLDANGNGRIEVAEAAYRTIADLVFTTVNDAGGLY